VQNLCSRAILLKEGERVYEGAPEEAASRYYAQSAPVASFSISPAKQSESDNKGRVAAMLAGSNIRANAKSEHGVRDLEVSRVGIFDLQANPTCTFVVGSKMRIVAELSALRDIANPSTGIHLYDRMNNLVFAAGTRQLKTPFADFTAGEKRLVEYILELTIQPGIYTLTVGSGQGSDDPNVGYVQHRLEGLGPIDVVPANEGTWPFYGIARLPLQIEIHG
jgi:lipopolysaccharide transport system ATP-binding protein